MPRTEVSRIARAAVVYFFLAAYIVISAFNASIRTYTSVPSDAIPPFLWLWAGFLAWHGAVSVMIKDKDKAASFALCLAVLIFSYDYIVLHAGLLDSFALLFAGIIVSSCAVLSFRTFAIIAGQTLSAIIVVYGGLCVFSQVTYYRSLIHGGLESASVVPRDIIGRASVHDARLYPDIYLIIMDGYGREDALKQSFGFDNRPFMDFLRGQGFRVIDESRSSYSVTLYSISSMLNLNYLQEDLRLSGDTWNDRTQIRNYYSHPRIVSFLRDAGYRFESASNGLALDFTGARHDGDIRAPDLGLRTWVFVLRNTPLYPLLSIVFGGDRTFLNLRYDYYERAKNGFSNMERIMTERGRDRPVFMYAHSLVTHPPFVIDAHGNFIGKDFGVPFTYNDGCWSPYTHLFPEGWKGYYHDRLPGQFAYANSRLEALLRKTLSAPSSRPRVVILIGDHGSRMETAFYGDNKDTNVYKNLSAVYYSDGDYAGISPDMNLTNLMRATVNKYFGTQMPMLPHRQWHGSFANLFFQEQTEADSQTSPAVMRAKKD